MEVRKMIQAVNDRASLAHNTLHEHCQAAKFKFGKPATEKNKYQT